MSLNLAIKVTEVFKKSKINGYLHHVFLLLLWVFQTLVLLKHIFN